MNINSGALPVCVWCQWWRHTPEDRQEHLIPAARGPHAQWGWAVREVTWSFVLRHSHRGLTHDRRTTILIVVRIFWNNQLNCRNCASNRQALVDHGCGGAWWVVGQHPTIVWAKISWSNSFRDGESSSGVRFPKWAVEEPSNAIGATGVVSSDIKLRIVMIKRKM